VSDAPRKLRNKLIGDLGLPKEIHNKLTNANYAFAHELWKEDPVKLTEVVGGKHIAEVADALEEAM
jgi:hypothetical protein